ncbi:fatty acyl-CoA reductase 1-like protein [Dinothrombium tinctorium]|uniref:Fatty acyl-CoA reductase n=1 Tax=Dinothrombium tinctorium TaxID=1965070 RepID=A0A443Q8U8_9ACAR|nr:fatty acyl-CoA reductase 1-like protein [Dinothrombium tinctorium]
MQMKIYKYVCQLQISILHRFRFFLNSSSILISLNMSDKDSIKSEIIPSFDGKNLLVTGVTGACGQVFLEKLLRVFTNIGTIFVLIRPKFNLTPQQRFERLLKSNLFKFHEYEESQLKKVKILEGDVTENELGLSPSDAQLLRESVNFVFHIAASISFAASFS